MGGEGVNYRAKYDPKKSGHACPDNLSVKNNSYFARLNLCFITSIINFQLPTIYLLNIRLGSW